MHRNCFALVFAVLVLLSPWTGAVARAAETWHELVLADDGFAMSVPARITGRAQLMPQDEEWDSGAGKVVARHYAFPVGGDIYTITATRMTAADPRSDRELMQSMGPADAPLVERAGRAGKEFIHTAKDGSLLFARVFAMNHVAYQVLVTLDPEARRPPDLDAWLASWRAVDATK